MNLGMIFTPELLKIKEFKKIKEEYEAFLDIFSPIAKKRLEENFKKVAISMEKEYNHSTYGRLALSEVQAYMLNEGENKGGIAKVTLVTDMNAKENVRLHEWWHALVFLNNPIVKDGYYLSGGLKCYNISNYHDVKGVGLEEGIAEVTATLAYLKKKCRNAQNSKEAYAILQDADKFMNTGELNTNRYPDYFKGYYKCLTDIVRLFIKASRNDFMLTHDFVEVLASSEGIDGRIGSPVNKPYSSFIQSAVYCDTYFQHEYDDIFAANVPGILPYEQVSRMMMDGINK